MRSDTAFLSSADIWRRFLFGLASGAPASAAAAVAGFLRPEDRRTAGPAGPAGRGRDGEPPSIFSTLFNVAISAWRRSI